MEAKFRIIAILFFVAAMLNRSYCAESAQVIVDISKNLTIKQEDHHEILYTANNLAKRMLTIYVALDYIKNNNNPLERQDSKNSQQIEANAKSRLINLVLKTYLSPETTQDQIQIAAILAGGSEDFDELLQKYAKKMLLHGTEIRGNKTTVSDLSVIQSRLTQDFTAMKNLFYIEKIAARGEVTPAFCGINALKGAEFGIFDNNIPSGKTIGLVIRGNNLSLSAVKTTMANELNLTDIISAIIISNKKNAVGDKVETLDPLMHHYIYQQNLLSLSWTDFFIQIALLQAQKFLENKTNKNNLLNSIILPTANLI